MEPFDAAINEASDQVEENEPMDVAVNVVPQPLDAAIGAESDQAVVVMISSPLAVNAAFDAAVNAAFDRALGPLENEINAVCELLDTSDAKINRAWDQVDPDAANAAKISGTDAAQLGQKNDFSIMSINLDKYRNLPDNELFKILCDNKELHETIICRIHNNDHSALFVVDTD